jgi:hypothetical protein
VGVDGWLECYRLGRPVTEENKTAVEWWATMRDGGTEITLPGILFLRFAPDGRCEEHRETWNYVEEILPPHPGWGA